MIDTVSTSKREVSLDITDYTVDTLKGLMTCSKTLGELLKNFRKHLGINQETLAKMIDKDLSKPYISLWESDEIFPSWEYLTKIQELTLLTDDEIKTFKDIKINTKSEIEDIDLLNYIKLYNKFAEKNNIDTRLTNKTRRSKLLVLKEFLPIEVLLNLTLDSNNFVKNSYIKDGVLSE